MPTVLTWISALGACRLLANGGALRDRVLDRLDAGRADHERENGAPLQDQQLLVARQGVRNVKDGQAFLQLAGSVLEDLGSLLTRAVELSRTAADPGGGPDRTAADREFQTILKGIGDVGLGTTFNGLAGFHGGSVLAVAVADRAPLEVPMASIATSGSEILGLSVGDLSLATPAGAATAAAVVDAAIGRVQSLKSALAGVQEQLLGLAQAIGVQIENLTAAASRMPAPALTGELVQLAKLQILSVSGASPQNPRLQAILSLLN